MTEIVRTINPCFPRSGHRFLRNLCKAYFGPQLIVGLAHAHSQVLVEAANFVKDHDFGLMSGASGIPIKADAQYLVQYRHPLEAVQSYFEFKVFHGKLKDSRDEWESFMLRALEYWKSFVHKWCLDQDELSGHCVYAVAYGSLYDQPKATLSDVIEFLTGGEEDIDVKRVNRSVTRYTGNFARYAEEEAEGVRPVSKARDIRAFRYFDDKLAEVEQALVVDYLTPLGLEQKLTD